MTHNAVNPSQAGNHEPEQSASAQRDRVISLGRSLIRNITERPTVGRKNGFSAVPFPGLNGVVIGRTSHLEADTFLIEDTGEGLHIETYQRRPSDRNDAQVRTATSEVTTDTDTHRGTVKNINFTQVDGDEIALISESYLAEYDLGALATHLAQLTELRDGMTPKNNVA